MASIKSGSMWVTYIYGLVDPRDGLVRYVGQPEDPDRRYREHLRAGCG